MEQMTFEQALRRVEQIVHDLETGDAPLEESMKLYEEGVRLVSFCSHALNDCKQRIAELSELENGAQDDAL